MLGRAGPAHEHAGGVSVDRVVHDHDVAHLRHLSMRGGGDAVGRGENQIVAHDRIGDPLDGLAAVPHRVALDDVEPGAPSVDEDARYCVISIPSLPPPLVARVWWM